MSQARFRRPRRGGMTPFRAVLVYALTFLLVAWHQSGRVAEWFDNQALEREGRLSETALVLAGFLRENVFPYGPAQLNHWEDRLLTWLTLETEMGAFQAPASRPVPSRPSEEGLKTDTDHPPPDPVATPETRPTWPDPEADPAVWLREVNPDEHLPEDSPEPGPPDLLPEPVRPPSPPLPRFGRVLLLGDSMMLEGLGPQLQKELRRRHESLTVERDGRYGTGLTRLDYFDWLDYFDRMLAKYTPDLVILTIGANDPQDILDPEGAPGRRRIHLGTSDWNEIYSARVAGILKLAEDRGVRVFWVGLPIMGREPYGSRVAGINVLTAAVCNGALNCRFWDSWLSVADAQGRFTSYALDENGRRLRIRGRDFIHLTEEGGRIMAQKFLAETKGWADFRAAEPTEPQAARPVAPEAAKAPTEPGAPPAQPLLRAVPVWPSAEPSDLPRPVLPEAERAVVPVPEKDDEDEFVDPLPVEPEP